MTRPSIFLHTLDSAMAVAWRSTFTAVAGIHVVEGDILEARCDAVISPANSFGFMDGGIDLAYRRYFGMDLQSRVQAKIRSEFRGDLPVGQATVVPTGNETVPYLVAAPTMRIPDRIGDTINVYLAFRAALLAVLAHNDGTPTAINSMRVPALGTGIGAMPLVRAARQMHAAFVSVFETPDRPNPDFAKLMGRKFIFSISLVIGRLPLTEDPASAGQVVGSRLLTWLF